MNNEKCSYVEDILCKILGYSNEHMYNYMFGVLHDECLREKENSEIFKEIIISGLVENKLSVMSKQEQDLLAKKLLECYIKPLSLCVNNGDLELAKKFLASMNTVMLDTFGCHYIGNVIDSEKTSKVKRII